MLVQHFLEKSAHRLPNKVALICGKEQWLYDDLNRATERLAGALIELGIKRQDRVVIMLDNSPEAVIALFGILKAGAIFVLINSGVKARKLRYILKDSGARGLITHSSKSEVVREAIQGNSDLICLISIRGNDSIGTKPFYPGTSLSWNDVMSSPKALLPFNQRACIDLDLATVIYTSGSTGEPKGVMCAHLNMVSAVRSITQYLGNVESDIILNVLSLSFDYGLYQVLMAFFFGGTVVLEKSYLYPYEILKRIASEKVTGFPLVPTMAALMLQIENFEDVDLSSLRYITNTAAALPLAHIRKFQKLLPHVKIFSMYGLTECKRVSYLPPEQLGMRPESVGIPMPNTEAYIADEMGDEVPVGELGELVVRGCNVMQGYWNAPEETARRFRPGRYRGETLLHTGDVFRRDEEGFLYFVARKDDMIKTKGERVSPKEIENVLCELEGVAEVAVIGVPDEILGHAIKAFIVPKKKSGLTFANVMAYCSKNLETFMIPKYVEFRQAFPKTASGKIDKKLLKIPLQAPKKEPKGYQPNSRGGCPRAGENV